MEWISVEDRLPGIGLVLVADEDGFICVGNYEIKHDGPAWRIGNDEVSWDFDYNLEYEVTHWMPLPDPPK